jgi:hypothetical protein
VTSRPKATSLRWPALVLIAALLAAMWLVEDDRAEPAATEPDSIVLGPLVAAEDSLGAFWYCAGGTGIAGGAADHNLVAINTTGVDRYATITLYGSRPEGGEHPEPVPITSRIPAYGRVERRLGEFLATDYVSATVEIDGGGVLVEHSITGPAGETDRAPCASTASASWTVPIGATDTVDKPTAREVLVFFNPFPADAVLDVTFSTDEGVRDPEPFVGFVVPGGSVVGVDLATDKGRVTVKAEVAAEVVARTGRVIVDRLQFFAEADPPRAGVALSSGVPTPAEAWVFPTGGLGPNRFEQVSVYNPSDLPAEVDVEVRPAADGGAGAEPFELTVQPHRHVQLDLASEERMATILANGTPYTLIVRSADGVPITAERLMWGVPGQPGAGVATGTGTALAGLRLVADMARAEADSTLVLFNPSTETIARVSLSIIDNNANANRVHEPDGDASVDLEPGATKVIELADLGAGVFSVLVESNVPIIGERDVVIAGERFTAIAVPAAAGASVAQLSLFTDFDG